jgi:hypothetical protein
MLRRLLSVALAAALAAPAPVAADDYFKDAPSSTAVTMRVPRERTTRQKVTIYGLLGGAAIFAGVGAWAHLDSRDAAEELEIKDVEPEDTWTDDRQATYDRGLRSRGIAVFGYAMSGGLLIGAAIAAYLTRPGDETIVVEPTRGGATVGAVWSW